MDASAKYFYRIRLAYKGTNFRGWQAQDNGSGESELRTVQGTIAQVLREISRYQDCAISGTSRTDAGVHAQGQEGRIRLPREIPADKLMLGLNTMLPPSIRILSCAPCTSSFNPKSGVAGKTYEYYLQEGPGQNPVLDDLLWSQSGTLDLPAMQEAARLFVGTYDFSDFHQIGSSPGSTTRTLRISSIEQVPCDQFGSAAFGTRYRYRVEGDGFLKYMVRYLVGAIVAVGSGELDVADVATHLHAPRGSKLSPKAPACGLHLVGIEFCNEPAL